jgi:solute carrier family 40 (iron-regulated transporter), member 1
MQATTSAFLKSRTLTRISDQMWEFALPLALVANQSISMAGLAFLVLVSKSLHLIGAPRVAAFLDSHRSDSVLQFSLFGRILCTLASLGLALVWMQKPPVSFVWSEWLAHLPLAMLALCMGTGNIFSTVLDINGGFLGPARRLGSLEFAHFQTRLRKVDVAIEIGIPFATGIILTLPGFPPTICLAFVAAASVVCLLGPLPFQKHSLQARRASPLRASSQPTQTQKFSLTLIFQQSHWPMLIAHALLWMSILSPQSIVLSAFLISQEGLTNDNLNIFRFFGAVAALSGTLLFPIFAKKWEYYRTTVGCLCFQALCLSLTWVLLETRWFGAAGYLIPILLSRVGLYGFTQGEPILRLAGVAPEARGATSGMSASLCSCATLIVYSLTLILPASSAFSTLAAVSAVSLLGAAGLALYSFHRFKIITKNLSVPNEPTQHDDPALPERLSA